MWSFKMAWRDSRGSRGRLLLFAAAMVLGVAALVATNGFRVNLQRALDDQARSLLGADLIIESDNVAFSDSARVLLDTLGGPQARQAERASFTSMVRFPATGAARLASIRAQEGEYPFYGVLGTSPPEAADTYQARDEALVDATLLRELGLGAGDSVAVGRRTYRIGGALERMPRESGINSLVSPRVWVPLATLDTSLVGFGSRVEYERAYALPPGTDAVALEAALRDTLRAMELGSDTAQEEAEDFAEGLGGVSRFLGLVAFLALLLGGLGVASAVHVYVQRRVADAALLRCLGASAGRTLRVYLIQAVAMGLVSAVAGAALGLFVQAGLPALLADFLPVDVPFGVALGPLLLGLGVGVGVTLLFALLPLLQVRNVSPLAVLRRDAVGQGGRDPWRLAVLALLVLVLVGAAMWQAPTWWLGAGYAVGVLVAAGALLGAAWLLVKASHHLTPQRAPWAWRYGVAGLSRPQNQTRLLTLTLGMGTFLLATLLVVQQSLVRQFDLTDAEGQPNVILFDIQPPQRDSVAALVREAGAPVLARVPIVPMDIQSVGGRTLDSLRADSALTWAHRRTYRSSYRDTLTASESIVEGAWVPRYDGEGPVPVSVERDLLGDLGLELGDRVTFEVAGVPIETQVASVREVDWRQFSTNFFVVFPAGALEDAPQTYVVLAKAEDQVATARLIGSVAQAFPNVIGIDAGRVLETAREVLGRLAFVLRFMAGFTLVVGLLVLVSAVLVSRTAREQEAALLKTLGASRRTVLAVGAVEHALLGGLAALAGVLLALLAAWALLYFSFETPLVVPVWALLGAVLGVAGLAVLAGYFTGRGVYRQPAQAVLARG